MKLHSCFAFFLIFASSLIAQQGLVAYYPFNGNANDESGNGNNGTIFGATITLDRFGNANKAFYFNGIDSRVELGEWFTYQRFTISFWVNSSDSPTSYVDIIDNNHFSDGNGNGRGFTFQGDNTGYTFGAVGFPDLNRFYLNLNKWQHIVILHDSTSEKIYIDGKLFDAVSFSSTKNIEYTNTSLGIARWYNSGNPSRFFKGKVDDIKLFNLPISKNVIDSLYHEGRWDPISLSVPNGSENWKVGEIDTIKWSSFDIANIRLEYTTNNGAEWVTITASTPANTGSYLWTVPNAPDSQCRIRISDAANSAIWDTSDSSFTIQNEGSINSDIIWHKAQSPYYVTGNITIENGKNLTIEPGVMVFFRGNYELKIEGTLVALGVPGDSIKFSADTLFTSSWGGLFLNNAQDCKLEYCSIKNSSNSGIRSTNSALTIRHCTIYGNSTSSRGAGIFSDSPVSLSNCSILYNTADIPYQSSGGGGGLYVTDSLTLDNCIIKGNVAKTYVAGGGTGSTIGGGVYCQGNLIIRNSIIYDNGCSGYSSSGGGIFLSGSGLIDSSRVFSNNVNTGGWAGSNASGGGIRIDGSLTIKNTSIYSNWCREHYSNPRGAAVMADNSVLTLINSKIDRNFRDDAYIIGTISVSDGTFTAINSIIADNALQGQYSGVVGGNAQSKIINCLIYNNQGYAFTSFNGSVVNSIIRNNGNTFSTPPLSVTFSNISGGYTGIGNFDSDPGVLSDSLFSLQANSACINAGSPDTSGFGMPKYDIGGKQRIVSERIDVGPNEFQSAYIRVTSPNGGEKILAGSQLNITWVSEYNTAVKLEYSVNNGANWSTISASYPADSMCYLWTVPSVTASQCKVRVISTTNSAIGDTSNTVFAIQPIVLTSPVGGEVWQAGTTQNITWASGTATNNVQIEFSTDNGQHWMTNAICLPAAAGVFAFKVPNLPSTQWLFKITDTLHNTISDSTRVCLSILQTQILDTFKCYYGGAENDELYAIDTVTGGGYILGGISKSFNTSYSYPYIIRTDQNGVKIWEYVMKSYVDEWYNCVIQTSDGGFLHGCQLSGQPQNAVLTKLDQFGRLQWQKRFGGSGTGNAFFEIRRTQDGNYVVIGNYHPGGDPSIYFLKIDESGNTLWERFPFSNVKSMGLDVKPLYDGGFAIASYHWTNERYPLVIKTDSSGHTVWSKIFTGYHNYFSGILEDADSTLILPVDAGVINPAPFFVLDKEGNTIHQTTIPNYRYLDVLHFTPDGNILSIGAAQGGETPASSVIKLTKRGEIIYQRTYSSDNPAGMILHNDKMIIAGRSNASGNLDGYLLKSSYPLLRLTSPVGGEYYLPGSTQNITWSSTLVNNVKIDYTTNNGTSWNTIIPSIAASSGSYAWTVPASVSSQCRVRIVAVENELWRDSSKTTFAISNPFVQVLSPNGGETWQAGTTHNVTWQAPNIDKVRLEFTTDSGVNWMTFSIQQKGANGSFQWIVPNVPSTQCRVRIKDINNVLQIDSSDALFTITSSIVVDTFTQRIGTDSLDVINGCIQVPDGGYAMVGYTKLTQNLNYDLYVVRTDGNGIKIWENTFGGTEDDLGVSIINDNDGAIAVLGSSRSNLPGHTNGADYYLVKIDKYGKKIFEKCYGLNNAADDTPYKFVKSLDGGYVMTGSAMRFGSNWYSIAYTIKADSLGNFVWHIDNRPTWQHWDSDGSDIVLNSDGTVSIVGLGKSYGQSYHWIFKINQNGGLIPFFQNNLNYINYFRAIDRYSDNSYLAGGQLYYGDYISKIDSLGNEQWGKTYGSDVVSAIKITPDQGALLITDVGTLYKIGKTGNLQDSKSLGTIGRWFDITTDNSMVYCLQKDFNQNKEVLFIKTGYPQLGLLSLNKGENIIVGNSININWTASHTGNLKLEYSTDNGSTWITIAASIPPAQGTYVWVVPNTISANCKIRISDIDAPSVMDVSSKTFKIISEYQAIGLLAYYPMSGTPNDTSGYGNNASNNGAISTFNRSGSANSAYNFNGTSSHLLTPAQNHLDSLAKGTVSFWIKTPPVLQLKEIITYSTDATTLSYLEIYIGSDGKLGFGIVDAERFNPKFSGTSVLQPSTWYHVTFMSDGVSPVTAYLNGQPEPLVYKDNGSATNGIFWFSSIYTVTGYNHFLTIGALRRQSGTEGFYLGNIDDVRLYNRALTRQEVDSLYFDSSWGRISITSPNGGEEIKLGSTRSITWTATNVGSVKIELTTANGNSWQTLAEGLPASQGSYIWTVPSVISDSCRVKITNTQIAENFDVSDSLFRIVEPIILLTSPAGGEMWEANSVQNITWSSLGVRKVKIAYTTDNGNSFVTIADSTNAFSHTNPWTIPAISAPACKIKVSDVDDPENVAGVTPGTFAITNPWITISAPNGGEDIYAGDRYNITWTFNDLKKKSSGEISSGVPTLSKKLMGKQDIEQEANVNSSASANRINGKADAETEEVTEGIESASVNIAYSTDNGSSWLSVAASVPINNLSYSWLVPATASPACKIKISNTANPAIFDTGNGTFRILAQRGLSAYYKLNGNAIDSSGYGNNGTAANCTNAQDRFLIDNRSYAFNGSNSAITAVHSSIFNSDSGITASTWIYPAAFVASQYVIYKANSSAGYYIQLANNKVVVANGILPSTTLQSTRTLNLNEWAHITMVYTGTQLKLYINGVLDTSVAVSRTINTTSSLYIGKASSASYFNGRLDDIRIYRRPLSDTEVAELHSEGGYGSVTYAGKVYHTVKIGTQTWLRENLDVGTMISGSNNQSNNGSIEKYCYNNDTANCTTYGGLYQWDEAMQYTTSQGTRGICPSGWHIPSYTEMSTLLSTVNYSANALKAVGQGSGAGSGNNSSGFSMLLTGIKYTNGSFTTLHQHGPYRTSSLWSGGTPYNTDVLDTSDYITIGYSYQGYGLPVRCLKDAPNVVLTSPNGYEILYSGEQDTVKWTSSSVSNIKLEYSTNNGAAWQTITASTPAATGKFIWTLPVANSTQCRLRISDASDYALTDISDTTFSIFTADTIIYAGQKYHTVQIGTQTWLRENLNVGVMVQGSSNQTNNGTIEKYCYNNDPVYCNKYGGLYQWDEAMVYTTMEGAQGICPTGWHVPLASEFQSLTALVGENSNVLKAIGQGTGNGSGTNESGFSGKLAGNRLIDGNYQFANTHSYLWSSSSNVTSEANVLGMYYENATFWQNYYDQQYGLSIRCIKDFTNIAVTAPVGGESWEAGTNQNITWTSSNVTKVKLEYTSNNGSTWQTVVDSVEASQGAYSWVVPVISSSQCKVRISDVANVQTTSSSNAVFSIINPRLTVTSPNGGENWSVGTQHAITWNYSTSGKSRSIKNTKVAKDKTESLENEKNEEQERNKEVTDATEEIETSNVKIELSSNGGSSWQTIVASTPVTAGSYNWTIPDISSTICKIKISDVARSTIFDTSDTYFTLTGNRPLFNLVIDTDSIWYDANYDGTHSDTLDASLCTISSGSIVDYAWYIPGYSVIHTSGMKMYATLQTGTNSIKLVVTSNSGYKDSITKRIDVYVRKMSTNGAILSGVSQVGNSFFVASLGAAVYKFDSTALNPNTITTTGQIQGTMCISEKLDNTGKNYMYVGSGSDLYCFNSALNPKWQPPLWAGGTVVGSASVNSIGDVMYIGTNSGMFKAINAVTGSVLWEWQFDGAIVSSPAVLELSKNTRIIYFGTCGNSNSKPKLVAVRDRNGNQFDTLWSRPMEGFNDSIISSPAILESGNSTMIYFGSRNGYLYRVRWDGYYQTQWRVQTGGAISSSPIIDENSVVYIASYGGYLNGYPSGFTYGSSPVHSFNLGYGVNGTPSLGPSGALFIGCDNGWFYALNREVGKVDLSVKWLYKNTAAIKAPTLVTNSGKVFIGDMSGDVIVMADPTLVKEGGVFTEVMYKWPTFKGNNLRSLVINLNMAPPGPAMQSPVDRSIALSTKSSLSWLPEGSAERYWVQISTNSGFNSIVFSDTNITSNSKNLDGLGLAVGTTYYWRVSAGNGYGFGLWADTLSFTTASVLSSTLQIDNSGAEPGDTIHVPIRVTNVNDLASLTLKLYYDHNLLEFLGIVNKISTLSTLGVVAQGDSIMVEWYGDPVAFNTGKLFDIKFRYIGADFATPISFATTNYSCELTNSMLEPITVGFVNGLVAKSASISGRLVYDNLLQTPLSNWWVTLLGGGNAIDSLRASSIGSFIFSKKASGTYRFRVISSTPWGGVTATDALRVRKAYGSMVTLSDLQRKAADVNSDGGLTSADALLIRWRSIGNQLSSWKIGNFVHDDPSVTIGLNSVAQDVKVLAAGDVNSSYQPSIFAKASASVLLETEESTGIASAGELILPIKMKSAIAFSALTLHIDFDHQLYDVVSVTSPLLDMLYRIEEGVLHIAWDDIQPKSFDVDDELFSIHLKAKNSLFSNTVTLEVIGESEFADENGNVVQKVTMVYPSSIKNIPSKYALKQNYPNPFNPTTKIRYEIPSDSQVRIELFDIMGQKVGELFSGLQVAGYHSIEWNASNLPSGVYICSMHAESVKDREMFNDLKKMLLVK